MNRGSPGFKWPEKMKQWSFNEAPIHESGKCPRRMVHGPGVRDASMRPRFMNRGSRDISALHSDPHLLQ